MEDENSQIDDVAGSFSVDNSTMSSSDEDLLIDNFTHDDQSGDTLTDPVEGEFENNVNKDFNSDHSRGDSNGCVENEESNAYLEPNNTGRYPQRTRRLPRD